MPETHAPIRPGDLNSMADLLAAMDRRPGPAPVDRWHPDRCGHSGMRIARDGRWWHDGRPIERPEMVRLFARVLRRDADGRHYLVTPVERLEIDVDTTPLFAIAMTMEGSGPARRIGLTLDSGDALIVGPAHRLRVVERGHGPEPCVAVRHGLEAGLTRALAYELYDAALAEGGDPPGLWSDGQFFALDRADPA